MKLKADEEKCGMCRGKGWTVWLDPDCNGTGKVKRRDTI